LWGVICCHAVFGGCRRYAIEAQIRAGHADLERLCRALVDWQAGRRLLRNRTGDPSRKARRGECGAGGRAGVRCYLMRQVRSPPSGLKDSTA
jgi:hypothetical protein